MNIRSIILMLITFSGLSAQRPDMPSGTITGQVIDANSSRSLEYANVMLYSSRDSSFISGATTNRDGHVHLSDLRPGMYYLKISFMGYENQSIGDIRLNRNQMQINLGEILLQQKILEAEEVNVLADKPLVEYQIDKKVVNVREEYSSLSGTAIDILENVPSINVDIEGNVQLRGSSSFTVLIDNRPTALDANDALQQIPATTIENIEIITNPSAKYDPEGISGIINIVTKKRRLEGISGLVNSNTGLDEKYGGNFLFSYRNGFGSISFGANYDFRSHPGISETLNRTTYDNSSLTVHSEGTSLFNRRRMGLNGEIQFFLSPEDNLGISFRSGNYRMKRGSDLNYEEYTDQFVNPSFYTSASETERGGAMLVISSDYAHRFGTENEFSVRLNYFRREGGEESSNKLTSPDQTVTSGQLSTEDGPSNRIQLQINHKQNLTTALKFEGGYDGRLGFSEDITSQSEWDTLTNQFILQPDYGHSIEYRRNIHALYSMLARESEKFGYQFGIRGELTDRKINPADDNTGYSIERWDVFPSVHSSYKINEMIQLMASYSKRINRPRGWHLEPFITRTDAYNVRQGNPNLKPEYVNSFELGFQFPFRKNLLSVETYYRNTINVIERIKSVYAPNIMLHTSENVGSSNSQGLELMFNLREIKWWEINLTGNIYRYEVDANINEEQYHRISNNWNIRFNNTFRFGENTRVQFSSHYSSPSVTSQGTTEGRTSSNLGIRQEFLERRLSATLQINDIFGSSVRESTSTGSGFYSYNRSSRNAPTVILTLSYNFNNFRQQRSPDRNGGGNDFEDDF